MTTTRTLLARALGLGLAMVAVVAGLALATGTARGREPTSFRASATPEASVVPAPVSSVSSDPLGAACCDPSCSTAVCVPPWVSICFGCSDATKNTFMIDAHAEFTPEDKARYDALVARDGDDAVSISEASESSSDPEIAEEAAETVEDEEHEGAEEAAETVEVEDEEHEEVAAEVDAEDSDSGDGSKSPTKRPTKKPSTRSPTRKPSKKPSKKPTKRPATGAELLARDEVSGEEDELDEAEYWEISRGSGDGSKSPTTKKPSTRSPTKKPSKKPTRKPLTGTEAETLALDDSVSEHKTEEEDSEEVLTLDVVASVFGEADDVLSGDGSKSPTKRPSKKPTTHSPTKKPTKRPTKKPTTHSPTTVKKDCCDNQCNTAVCVPPWVSVCLGCKKPGHVVEDAPVDEVAPVSPVAEALAEARQVEEAGSAPVPYKGCCKDKCGKHPCWLQICVTDVIALCIPGKQHARVSPFLALGPIVAEA